jgi:hypothetical protein
MGFAKAFMGRPARRGQGLMPLMINIFSTGAF